MALTTAADISIVLSGGTNNLDPNLALGGDPSSAPIIDGILNNLFDDISPDESEEGAEDYRCLYIFNDGSSVIYKINMYIASDFEAGATVELGIEDRTETQRIVIDNIPTDGSLSLSYEGHPIISAYNSDLGQWALNLQQELNSITDGTNKLLQGVSITAEVSSGSTIFDINFTGSDDNKNHSEILIVENNLLPSGMSVNISTPQRGAPINTIAPQINIETTPPGGVSFFPASESQPISLPQLFPDEGFPIWVKRTVEAGTTAVANDGFLFRFSSESLSE